MNIKRALCVFGHDWQYPSIGYRYCSRCPAKQHLVRFQKGLGTVDRWVKVIPMTPREMHRDCS